MAEIGEICHVGRWLRITIDLAGDKRRRPTIGLMRIEDAPRPSEESAVKRD